MAPGEADDRDDGSPDESTKERVDRELIELLNDGSRGAPRRAGVVRVLARHPVSISDSGS